jgi:hypothetical protein
MSSISQTIIQRDFEWKWGSDPKWSVGRIFVVFIIGSMLIGTGITDVYTECPQLVCSERWKRYEMAEVKNQLNCMK